MNREFLSSSLSFLLYSEQPIHPSDSARLRQSDRSSSELPQKGGERGVHTCVFSAIPEMLRLKLKQFMRPRGLTEAALTDAIADVIIARSTPVSERTIRYLVQNDQPLTAESKLKKPSMQMLGYVITGLRHITGEEVEVGDVLEFVSEASREGEEVNKRSAAPPENAVDLVLYQQDWSSDDNAALLVPLDLENEEDLDEIWEMTIHALRRRGFGASSRQELATIPATASVGEGEPSWSGPGRRAWWRSPIVSLALLFTLIGYVAYDHLIANPRLLERYIQLVSFRDRVRPTSELRVPTLIGPEGEINQATPILRVGAVPGVVAYEFYVENTVSDEGVYSGPVPNNSFPVPDASLCADTTYAWRARALGNDGWTSFSSPVNFRVAPATFGPDEQQYVEFAGDRDPPEVPEIVAPIGSTNSATPVLEVTEIPRVLGYGFYIRDLRSDAVVYDNNFVTDHRVQLPEGVLEDGGVYQWNARVRNCHYWSKFSPVQVFTVNVRE